MLFKDSVGNNIGPMRVRMKHEDIPGLAMSRSLATWLAKSLEVVCNTRCAFLS